MENKITMEYDLTEEERDKIEALFNDLGMHTSILAEMAQSNPSLHIKDTTLYADCEKIRKSYNETTNHLVTKYTKGEFDNSSANWEIKFNEKKLCIYK